jgi:hypothetical protein
MIVNNKWVFPNHFLAIPGQHILRSITPERIWLLAAIAERLPSFMCYATSRGFGNPDHFHGHVVKSAYIPPLARQTVLRSHLSGIGKYKDVEISEVQNWPSQNRDECVGGWAVTGPWPTTAEAAVAVAT